MVIASNKACQHVCTWITRDIFSGVEEAAYRIHYGTLHPHVAFFCLTPGPDCPVNPHSATMVDDEWICSVNGEVGGELTS